MLPDQIFYKIEATIRLPYFFPMLLKFEIILNWPEPDSMK